MLNLRSMLRPLVVAPLMITIPMLLASTSAVAQQNSANEASEAGNPNADQSLLFRPLQSIVGTAVTDASGDQGTIVDLVVDHDGQYQTPGIFSYVAVKFPQMTGGATYLVPNTYFTPPSHQILSLTISGSALRNMPVLSGQSLPAAVTSAHPGAVLATTMMGATVTSSTGATLGTVKQIMVNLAHKSIDYFAVAPSTSLPNGLYAVPAGETARFSSGTLPLTITAKQFGQLMGFSSSQLPVESGLTGYTFAPQGLYPVAKQKALANALVLSMHEEAHANMAYRGFATEARQSGHPIAANLWDTVAKVELEYHFRSDASMAGMIQNTVNNLMTSISTEQQTIATFGSYAQNAQQAGYTSIASTYQSLIQMEQGQLSALQSALSAVQGGQQPTTRSIATAPPQFKPVPVVPGKPQAEGQTEVQLKLAIKVASYQFALYNMYARLAADQAYPYVSAMFDHMSKAESQYAVPTLSNLAGAVSLHLDKNLAITVGAERNAHNRYVTQAQLAAGLGDNVIAQQIYYNGYMEEHHGDAFQTLLDANGGD